LYVDHKLMNAEVFQGRTVGNSTLRSNVTIDLCSHKYEKRDKRWLIQDTKGAPCSVME